MKPFDPALLPHLRPARGALAAGLAGGLGAGLLTVGQAFATGLLVVRLVQDPAGDGWHEPGLWLVAVVMLRALASYVVDVSAARASGQVAVALRHRLLKATTDLEASELGGRHSGETTLLATRGIAATEPYLTRYLPTLVLAVVLPPAAVLAIWWLDWLSGLIVVLTIPLVPVFAILIGLVTRDRADAQWRALSTLSGHFLDVVRGLPTLVAFRRADAQATTIRSVTHRYRVATVETLKVAFLSSAALELIATISVALVAVAVGLRLAHGSIEFETAVIVLLLAPEAYWPLRRVGAEFHAAAEGTAAFTRLTELLDGSAPGEDVAATHVSGFAGDLVVTDITCTYAGRATPALLGVSASFPAIGLTAVTGPSGCGKSTLLAALLGEVFPTAGTITVGGRPLRRGEIDAWRSEVAWAPQRPWLTSRSVAENLRIGRPGASDADLWAALERVGLSGVVAGLEGGLSHVLGEDGAGLSAGQRARLSLARVVVADRPWVLLDEPTAHLDEATEAIMLDTISWLAERGGVVVVAHRDAVVARADHVVALTTPPAVTEDTSTTAAPAIEAPRRADARPVEDRPMRWGRRTGVLLGAGSVAFGVALTATAAWLITRASAQPPVLYLMVAIVGVRLFGLGRPVLRYAERVVSHDAALRLLADRRAEVYDRLVPLVPGALGKHRGDVLSSVVDDVDAVVDQELRVRQPIITSVVVALGAVAFALLQQSLAGVVAAGVVVLGLLSLPLARWGTRRAERDFVEHRAALSRTAEEVVSSARDLVLWQAVDPALDRVDQHGRELARAAVRAARAVALGRALPLVLGGLGVLAMAAVVGPRAEVDMPMLALLVMLPIALVDVFVPLADAGALSVRTQAAQRRLDDLACQAPRVTDPASPAPAPQPPLGVRTRDLAAGWGEQPAFAGLDLDLAAGHRLAVVGPSGCGKSTLAAVLIRFLDPRRGSAHLAGLQDERDLRDLRLDDVRRLVGLVDDDPHVFASTIAENVRLARPDASDDDVSAALSAAHLDGWLAGLPRGIHTFVGEGHAQVSGGERARLAIARLLLADHPVVVLDEPTAHLDSGTAKAIAADVLGGAGRTRTIVWITHGTAGLDLVDEVLTMGSQDRSPVLSR